jgi:hypothetical protein
MNQVRLESGMARRISALMTAAAMVTGCLIALMANSAQASTDCLSPHCYVVIAKRNISPLATVGSINLNTKCITESGSRTLSHSNNEIWADTVTSGEYVEFGHTINYGDVGVPTDHWFWERHENGGTTFQKYPLNIGFVNSVTYNATIKFTGSAGSWLFYQGGTLFGSGAGNYPTGPVLHLQAGTEIYATPVNADQDNVNDTGGTMVVNGVSRSWSPQLWDSDIPPFATPSWGDTYVSTYVPAGPHGSSNC